MNDGNKTDSPTAHERYEKSRAAELDYLQQAKQQSSWGDTMCARPGLRERVNGAFYRAENESRKCDRLKELADLLDTNPAIARILELIEQTQV